MSHECDLIILGAGPAGAEAACVARQLGAFVVVLEESPLGGGQVYRAPAKDADGAKKQHAQGNLLRARLAASGADVKLGHRVWDVSRQQSAAPYQFKVSAIGPNGLCTLLSKSLIVATGATELVYPRPGWTTPGVVGLAAATILMKSQGVLPGKKTVVAGAGPLLSLVAHLIIEAGGSVAALVDVSPFDDWLSLLPRMIARPDLLVQGIKWQIKIAQKMIPVYREYDIAKINGGDGVQSVDIRALRDDSKVSPEFRNIHIQADSVCFGYGLTPATEVYRLLGAEHEHNVKRGGWIPLLDDNQRTSISMLYGAGDGAGLLGAAAAPLTGALAANAALFDLGKQTAEAYAAKVKVLKKKLLKASKFGAAMASLTQPRTELVRNLAAETIVCRCEDITAGEINAAIEAGAENINALKFATRCGMGPCGGKMCGESVAALMECQGIQREVIGQFTARPPLRPIAISDITQSFEYSDIPLPEPAPA